MNRLLEEEGILRARQRKHPDQRDKTVWEVYLEEQKYLVPIQGAFDAFVPETGRVSKTLLVHYDRNKYSVEGSCFKKTVDLRAYADRLVFACNGNIVGEHQRSFGRDEIVTKIEHYLDVLCPTTLDVKKIARRAGLSKYHYSPIGKMKESPFSSIFPARLLFTPLRYPAQVPDHLNASRTSKSGGHIM